MHTPKTFVESLEFHGCGYGWGSFPGTHILYVNARLLGLLFVRHLCARDRRSSILYGVPIGTVGLAYIIDSRVATVLDYT